MISPEEYTTTKEDEQRTYHNRADGGFVYFDDGSYTSGLEKLDKSTSNDSLMMTSLSFSNRHRIWMTVNTLDVLEAIDTFNDEKQQILNLKMLELSRPVSASTVEGDSNDATIQLSTTQIPNVIWKKKQRVRMPNTNQAWSLARAKWERREESIHEEDEAMKGNNGKFIGWSLVSQDDPDTYAINLMAACTASGVARSTLRCYDTKDGTLKSHYSMASYLQHQQVVSTRMKHHDHVTIIPTTIQTATITNQFALKDEPDLRGISVSSVCLFDN